MIWVGKLGAASIAGVGVSALVVQLINTMMMGLATGMRAMIARFIGAGDAEGANHVAMQGFVVSAGFSMIMVGIGIFLAEPILVLFGLEADVVAEGAAYLRIMFAGSAAMSFLTMAEGIMQASGDTVTPMRISIFVRLLHVALVPFLIFGWWLFPHMGVSGAALTNIISHGLGLAIGSWVFFSGRTRLRLALRNFRLDPNIIWRIVKIGLPSTAFHIQRVFTYLVLMRFVAPFGTLAVAAKSLFRHIETLIVNVLNTSLGRGAGVLAAQNLGAGQPERAERSVWLVQGFAEALMVIRGVAMLLWAEWMFSIFSPNPGVMEMASTFLRIATVGFFALTICQVFNNSISDVGDTLPPMLVSVIGTLMMELPLAFFLSRFTNLGVYGVLWGTNIGQFVRAVAYIIYFKTGRWKRKNV